MNWLLRQSPWLHSQNLVIVTPHLDTFLWLCKVLLWSWPWLQEFKLASVSWIAVWSGAVISRWHLTKNVSSIKNTRHFYIFFATTWLAAWFFQFGKGFVEPKRVGLVREKKRVGSDQGPTLNYASPEGQRCLEPALAFVVQPPLPPGRSGRWSLVGGCWLRSGSCGVRRQVWPWMPRQESSVEHRRSRLLRCRFLSDEWPRKWGPFDFWVKKQIYWGGFMNWNDWNPYETSMWTYCYQFVLLFMVGLARISWANWQGWGAYCHGQSSWLLSAEKLAHINWEMLPKAPKFSANPGQVFFCFQFFLKSIILWMSWVGSDFFSMLVVGIF